MIFSEHIAVKKFVLSILVVNKIQLTILKRLIVREDIGVINVAALSHINYAHMHAIHFITSVIQFYNRKCMVLPQIHLIEIPSLSTNNTQHNLLKI